MSAQDGFRQFSAAKFRHGNERLRQFAADSSVVSASIDGFKTLSTEVPNLIGSEGSASKNLGQVLDTGRAATALPGDVVDIADALRDSRGEGWKTRTAAGAAASHALLKDLGTMVGGVSVVTTALSVAPALPMVAAGLTLAGAGVALWNKQRERQELLNTHNGRSTGLGAVSTVEGAASGGSADTGGASAAVGFVQGSGGTGGSLVQQLRQQLAQLDLQLGQLSAQLGEQQAQLRTRGQQLSELIGGSTAERAALVRLDESIKAIRRSRSAVAAAKDAVGKLQL